MANLAASSDVKTDLFETVRLGPYQLANRSVMVEYYAQLASAE
jgi:hypothetical protein